MKATKIPQSHNDPFQAFYSTKILTIGKEPEFKTEERARMRKDCYQSLEREKSHINKKVKTEKKRQMRKSCDRKSIDEAFQKIMASPNFDDKVFKDD